MYIVAFAVVAFAEKYALGTNVIISSVPGNSGKQLDCVLVGTTAPEDANADVCPYPKITTTAPLLIILYWLPPSVADGTCTGAGAVVVAVMTIVLPQGENGADTDIIVPVEAFVVLLFLFE